MIASDGPGVRQVRGEASAGCDPGMAPLSPGQVIRINTGAPIPPGADAVVMVENTKLVKKSPDGQEELEVEILTKVTPGQDIRPVGCDIKTGEKVLSGGQVLGSGELGVMAAVGVTKAEFQMGLTIWLSNCVICKLISVANQSPSASLDAG